MGLDPALHQREGKVGYSQVWLPGLAVKIHNAQLRWHCRYKNNLIVEVFPVGYALSVI